MMNKHFLINAVNALYTPVNLRRLYKFLISESISYCILYRGYKGFTFALFYFQNMFNFRISKGIKVMKSQIFKLFFNSSHSETMSNRSVNIHSFMSRIALFNTWTKFQCTHIMKSVSQLNNNNSYILRHGKKHFSYIFRLLFLLIKYRNLI